MVVITGSMVGVGVAAGGVVLVHPAQQIRIMIIPIRESTWRCFMAASLFSRAKKVVMIAGYVKFLVV
jgi:phosphate/sulfate permease